MEEKVLRSFVHEKFPLDLRVQIELISRRRDIRNKEKQQEIIQLLQNNNIGDFVKLGPGTNRYAFKLNGLVIKVATDNDGKIDNLKEFKMAKRLYPYVTKVYEVSENGDLLIAEYIQPFSSYSEMCRYADKIRAILTKLSSMYLIGDVGISSNNYANWGLRVGSDEPVCLDFAYVYDVSSSLFVCRSCKGDPGILVPDRDFNRLHCTKCGVEKRFEDIRGLIGNDLHRHEIGDLSEEGYKLSESYVPTILTPSRSNYLLKKVKENKNEKNNHKQYDEDSQIKNDESETYQNDQGTNNIHNNKEENIMDINNVKTLAVQMIKENPNAFKDGIKIIPVSVVKAEDYTDDLTNVSNETPKEEMLADNKPDVKVETSVNDTSSTLAFSGKLVEVKTEISNEDTKHNDESDENTGYKLSPRFINNAHPAIKKLSNRIAWDIRCHDVYNLVKPYLKDKKMTAKAFYDNVESSILQSLAAFTNFTEKDGFPNKDNNGTHSEYVLPSFISGAAYEPTIIFIERMWVTREIMHLNDPSTAAIDTYHVLYDDYSGIQSEWIPIFKGYLSKKIAINPVGLQEIINVIEDDEWVVPVNSDDDINDETEELEEIEEEVLSTDSDENSSDEEEIMDLEEEPAGDCFGVYKVDQMTGEVEEVGSTNDSIDTDDEDEDYEEEYADYTSISIDVYLDDEEAEDRDDIIKLYSSDAFGNVAIPFYTNLNDVNIDGDQIPSMVDDRNGIWDFLIHITPDIMFRTNDPEKWLEVNNYDYDETNGEETHIVILDKNDDEYIMGIYYISGINIIDQNGDYHRFTDKTLFAKVCKVIKEEISYGRISHLRRSISMTELIHDEEYIIERTTEIDDEDDEEDTIINNEENEDMVPEQVGELEDAALKAIMGETADDTSNDENVVSNDTEVSEKENEVNGNDHEPAVEETAVTSEAAETTEAVDEVPVKKTSTRKSPAKKTTVTAEKEQQDETLDSDEIPVVTKKKATTKKSVSDEADDEIPVKRRNSRKTSNDQ